MPTRTIRGLIDGLPEFARDGRLFGLGGRRPLPAIAADILRIEGEASALTYAAEFFTAWDAAPAPHRLEFLHFLRDALGPEPEALNAAIDAWRGAPGPATETALHLAAEPRRIRLLSRLNAMPGGAPHLLMMRESLLGALREDPSLAPVDADFEHLLSEWFNRGFLSLRRIDWTTPAFILEKIIAYEAVHAISGWDDLRRRLAPDRRCFGFFHPALPDEPLIFVEVALTRGLAWSVQELLEPASADPSGQKPDTAIFYSISNCQPGLKGVGFGDFLIKQVVTELQAEGTGLSRFSTLSPIPGFRRWLRQEAEGMEGEAAAALRALADPARRPARDEAETHRDRLQALCARYLAEAKRGRMPLDPVARFHLRNGARLERINWMGDVSENGMTQSLGMLVNYLYDARKVEANHEALVKDGAVATGAQVSGLLRKAG